MERKAPEVAMKDAVADSNRAANPGSRKLSRTDLEVRLRRPPRGAWAGGAELGGGQ